MCRIPTLMLLAMTLLTGCGEVVIFGRVVREGNQHTEVKESVATVPASTAPSAAMSSSSSSSQNSLPATTSIPVIPPITPAQPSVPASPAKGSTDVNTPVKVIVQSVKSVTLSIAPELANKVAADSRFDRQALIDAIKIELQSRKLLDSSDSNTAPMLSIYIDNYDLHATTNFSIFGAKPHTGTLAGNLMLSDEQGESTPISHIEAYSRISVPENGGDKNLLQPLYRDFAVTVANSLTGIHSQTSADREQPPR